MSSNLFILANAPYLSKEWDWELQRQAYGHKIAALLEQYGLEDISQGPVWEHYTPADIQRDTYAHQGAIYGISSNSVKQTFSVRVIEAVMYKDYGMSVEQHIQVEAHRL